MRRQLDVWQREATRDLATGRTAAALGAYDAHGIVHAAATRDELARRPGRAPGPRSARPRLRAAASSSPTPMTARRRRGFGRRRRERRPEAGDPGAEVGGPGRAILMDGRAVPVWNSSALFAGLQAEPPTTEGQNRQLFDPKSEKRAPPSRLCPSLFYSSRSLGGGSSCVSSDDGSA